MSFASRGLYGALVRSSRPSAAPARLFHRHCVRPRLHGNPGPLLRTPLSTETARSLGPASKLKVSFAALTLLAALEWAREKILHADAPKFRLSEVHQHGRNAERQWVVKGTSVYVRHQYLRQHRTYKG